MRRKTKGIKANQRFAFILFVFMVILTVLFGRVLYWKVVHGAEFEAAAKNQQINRYDLVNAANRGSILDRNEQVLAVSTAVYNVVLDPLQLAEEDDAKKTKKTFDTLCEYFPDLHYEDLEYHITKNQETGKINTPTHWKYLVKGVERSVKEELEKKNRKYILLQVSDIPKTILVLERRFQVKDYSVQDEQTIRIYDTELNMGELNMALVMEAIAVLSSGICNDTLEDYFKKLTGGEGIA